MFTEIYSYNADPFNSRCQIMPNSPKPLIDALVQALLDADLWTVERPSTEAMNSQQPFAVDTMSFEQWLKFVFIPKFSQMAEQGMLPAQMEIAPMAQVTWPDKYQAVVRVLSQLDAWVQDANQQS